MLNSENLGNPKTEKVIFISIDINHAIDVRKAIEKIAEIPGVEVDYGAN